MNVPQLLGIGLRLLALHLISLALQLLALQTLMVQQHEISPLLQFAFPRWGFALPLLLLPPAIWLLMFTINLYIPLIKLPRALSSGGTWQLLLPFSLLLFLLRTRLARRLFAAG